ncbi:GntR family transcriptional regulator [Marinobacterium rhizophilum]|uniref:FCD domain-containing protein n=1 Tax=Marinobacterium rhizophilum TaxID=420402 RepID=A0ABY5HGM4_9GAMM|nr:GntR family transcriptional regulator [Marinobacterium rhizophilum]UTW11393.1 FCD domain-containing protein [Marinobacterium rhizophilum]
MEQQLFTNRLQDLKSQSLSRAVEEQLEQMILSGELLPGERINESYLSNTLKISRAPIREACRQLAQYGMVENRVGKGSYVRQVNLEEALELYELRGVLDALAAEKASQNASSEGIAGLGLLVEQMRSFAARHESTEYFATNLKFHHQIVQLAGSAALIDLYEVVFKKLSLFRQKTLSQPDRLQRSLSQHEGIFAAIQNRDAQLGSQLARSHVEEAKGVLLATKV